MRTFYCSCGNRLFFENVLCLACGREVGWCEGCAVITSFKTTPDASYTCNSCGQTCSKCINFTFENVCNRFCATSLPGELCKVCKLTETIPDLSVEGNRDKWIRLEQAKRRLIYQLDLLELPYRHAIPPLRFDFKANVIPADGVYRKGESAEHVYTGHADGKITINIQEADDVERERLRVDMNEPHRTLIGHFRHEVGHYYWMLLVEGQDEDRCVSLFGNHNDPNYSTALSQYYQAGPPSDWNANFISAYATAHPWEDFAETFALYLDIRSVLDTAEHLKLPLPKINHAAVFAEYVFAYQQLGVPVNELNRCMGIFDLVPEVIAAPVVTKLEYIHELVGKCNKQSRDKSKEQTTLVAATNS